MPLKSESNFENVTHIQMMRRYVHEALGWAYVPYAPMPDIFMPMVDDGLLYSRSGQFDFRGRVQGHAYEKQRFELTDITAEPPVEPKRRGLFERETNTDPEFIDLFSASATQEAGFQGIVMSLDHHTRFAGKTIMRRDRGRLNPLNVNGMKRIGFASSEFERLFEVYSHDAVEAHALLTPDFMARLIDFAADYMGRNVQCLFWDDKVHIALDIDDRFDFSKNFTAYDFSDVATRITHEIGAIFYLLEKVQALQARIGRHGKFGADKLRHKYYRTLLDNLRPAIKAANSTFNVAQKSATPSFHSADSWQHLMLQPRI